MGFYNIGLEKQQISYCDHEYLVSFLSVNLEVRFVHELE